MSNPNEPIWFNVDKTETANEVTGVVSYALINRENENG